MKLDILSLHAPLLIHIAVAMPGAQPWTLPVPTPIGLTAIASMSPRPTEAPGLNGLPKELKRQNVRYPPPENWCGFVAGQYDYPLSCGAGSTCVNSGAAIGCCTATTGFCSDIYTTCINYVDFCDAACQNDPGIRRCDAGLPFCGTFAFSGGTHLYNCQTTTMTIADVEYLADYYVTAIGSTFAPSGQAFSVTNAPALAAPSGSASSTGASITSGSSYTSSSSSSIYDSGGISQAALDGIAAGVSIVGILMLGLIAFFCVRSRKRKRMARANGMSANTECQPQMQQQTQPMPPPKAFDGYQSVPQQEHQQQFAGVSSPPPQQEIKPQYVEAPSPPPQQAQQQSYIPTPIPTPSHNDNRFSSASILSPNQTDTTTFDSRLSSPSIISANPTGTTSAERQSYFKAPFSPAITEVDGTMGNPSVPLDMPHGQPLEVDGTMGNPGVPAGGHGIGLQGVAGGSPNATEVEGTNYMGQRGSRRQGQGTTRASLNQPFVEGPFEMGDERR